MKKIFLLLALTIFVSSAIAQDVEQVLKKFETASGLNKIDLKNAESSMMFDLVVETQGMKIPMKMITKGVDKFRIEMEAMGQKMLMVRDGDKGWMLAAGNLQPLPKEALDQQASQANVVSSMKIDRDKNDIEYVGVEGNFEVIKVTPKDKNNKAGIQTLYFDKTTGLLSKLTAKADGVDVEVTMTDYKDMGGLQMPSIMDTAMGGKSMAKVLVNRIELDYPTAPWMFAEPKK